MRNVVSLHIPFIIQTILEFMVEFNVVEAHAGKEQAPLYLYSSPCQWTIFESGVLDIDRESRVDLTELARSALQRAVRERKKAAPEAEPKKCHRLVRRQI